MDYKYSICIMNETIHPSKKSAMQDGLNNLKNKFEKILEDINLSLENIDKSEENSNLINIDCLNINVRTFYPENNMDKKTHQWALSFEVDSTLDILKKLVEKES